RKRNKGAVVSSSCSPNDVRVVRALGETDGSRCHPGALPSDACFRITSLRDVNQFGQIVRLAWVDGRQIAPFSFSRLVLAKFSFISWKRRWRPRPHRRGRGIIAGKYDPNRREQLCHSDERDLHKNLLNLVAAFHQDSFWLIVT